MISRDDDYGGESGNDDNDDVSPKTSPPNVTPPETSPPLDEDRAPKRCKEVACCIPYKKPSKETSSRLPTPCPAPTMFSQKTMVAIETNQLKGTKKLALLREASLYYYGYCQNPTPDEYNTMARVLCEKYPQLKDKLGQYDFHDWVSLHHKH